jgi:hypothetical protein
MKFEYKILTISTAHLKKETFQAELITKFNELGSLGWELINAEGITEGSILWSVGETVELIFIFKRRTD